MKKSISLLYLISILFLTALSSCFTGIESTKKINLSRDDKKNSAPTQEELFFSGITATPLKDWTPGRKFIVSDNKALLLFESIHTSLYPDTASIKGSVLQFEGVKSSVDAAGNITTALLFNDGTRSYLYDTGKEFDNAMETVMSDALPMLIDSKMVENASNLLSGKRLWIRSNLWYNEKGERIDGKKYVVVTIEDVKPGDMVFPLHLKLSTDEGEKFFVFMNFGNNDTESRSFNNLFSLSDLRKNYPAIQPEIWDLICEGKVTAGMTKLECKLALGNPIDITSGHDYSQTIDIWTYDNGKILWFEDGKLTRYKGQ